MRCSCFAAEVDPAAGFGVVAAVESTTDDPGLGVVGVRAASPNPWRSEGAAVKARIRNRAVADVRGFTRTPQISLLSM